MCGCGGIQVQEVVFLADFRCPKCQHRVAEIMAKMNGKYRFSLEFYFFCAFGYFHRGGGGHGGPTPPLYFGPQLVGFSIGFLLCNDKW